MRPAIFISTAFLLLLHSWGAYAEPAYKWVDKKGQVHYGEFPPSSKAKEMETSTGTPSSPAPPQDRMEQQKKVLEQLNEDKIKKREAKEKADKENESAKTQCNAAKGRLTIIEESGRLRTNAPDGSFHYIEGDERKKMIEELKQSIKKTCK